jgi:DNA replication protein DnaC
MKEKNKINARLIENLEYLNLKKIMENYATAAVVAAENGLPHVEFLEELIEDEVAGRRQRSAERRLREARLPYVKTFDQFKWGWPDKINQPQIKNLFRLEFVEQKANAIFLGSCGVGKSHLALALAYQACLSGISVLFTRADELIDALDAAKTGGNIAGAIKKYTSPSLLVIDELGFESVGANAAGLFFKVISRRYERGSVIITTNRPYSQWVKIFQDSAITEAIIERTVHHSQTVVIEGNSYRMKDKLSI